MEALQPTGLGAERHASALLPQPASPTAPGQTHATLRCSNATLKRAGQAVRPALGCKGSSGAEDV